MEPVRVGIIGIGNMGGAHLKCIAEGRIAGMSVSAVCDTDARKTQAAKMSYPDIEVYSDYKDLLKNSKTDAVIVATPHPLHAQMGIDCLNAGKHMLVEKPIDITVSAAERLGKAASSSGKVFGIMFNQRTNDLFRAARDIVQGGELGELKRTVWIITNWYRTQSYYDSGDWRATWSGEGGGVLINQAPHNLDLWQWICGMPEKVRAFCNTAKFHDIEVEDEATLYTEYKNGASGVFITSTGDYPGTNRLEISGTRGKLVLENGVLKHWRLKQDEREVCRSSAEGFCGIDFDYSEHTCEKESGHAGILQNFANAILCGEPLLADGREGIRELTLSNAAYLSEWTGNAPITLPFDQALFDRMLAEKAAAGAQRHANTGGKGGSEYLPRWQVRW